MSDTAPTTDSHKTPPPDNTKPATDNSKPNDSTSGQNEAGKNETTVGKLMAEVHSEWDSFKNYVGLSSDSAKGSETGRNNKANSNDTTRLSNTGKPSEPSSVEVTNIYKSTESTDAATTAASSDGKQPPTASVGKPSGEAKTTADGQSSGETKSGASQGDTQAAGDDKSAQAPAPEQHWWDGITSAGSAVAGFVENGWDALSDKVGSTYDSIIKDSDNKTTRVEAKVGTDGKPEYFQSSNDNGTRTLTQDERRFTDAKGGTIVKNTKTGEITSQSADGDDIYTRKADGTEIYRSKKVEYTKNKDGTYEARDDKGDVTQVSDQGAITKIDGIFKVAQRITSIDATTAKPEKGQLETMTDGQRYEDQHGNVIVHRTNGINEVTTTEGQHFRFDKAQHKVEIEENGQWRALSREAFQQLHHCQMHDDGHGGSNVDVAGVKVDSTGKVTTDDKVTLGATTLDGKIVSIIPTESGKPAVITTNPDHTSTLDLNGHLTKVNPDDKTHLVQRFQENPDGSLGNQEFCYNSQDQSFSTPDLTWTPDGTYLGWNGDFIDTLGTVFDSNNDVLIASADDYADTQAQNKTDDTLRAATSACADVGSKVGSQSLDSTDLSALNSSLGELDSALNLAMTNGNIDAACQIIKAKADVESAIAQASQQVALTEAMKGSNVTEGDTVTAQSEIASRGVGGASGAQEARVLGPNAQTFQGRLAYMQEFGISGLTEEQERRLSA